MTKVIVLLSTVILLGCGAEASEDQVGETATLVINIGQFEKVRIQSRLPDGLLEQGFVGPGRTGSHYHAVQAVLLDGLPHSPDAIRKWRVGGEYPCQWVAWDSFLLSHTLEQIDDLVWVIA